MHSLMSINFKKTLITQLKKCSATGTFGKSYVFIPNHILFLCPQTLFYVDSSLAFLYDFVSYVYNSNQTHLLVLLLFEIK